MATSNLPNSTSFSSFSTSIPFYSLYTSISSCPSSSLSCDWSMEVLLRRWRLQCVHISLESFGAEGPVVGGSTLPGRHSIQMMVITMEKEEKEERC